MSAAQERSQEDVFQCTRGDSKPGNPSAFVCVSASYVLLSFVSADACACFASQSNVRLGINCDGRLRVFKTTFHSHSCLCRWIKGSLYRISKTILRYTTTSRVSSRTHGLEDIVTCFLVTTRTSRSGRITSCEIFRSEEVKRTDSNILELALEETQSRSVIVG